MNSKNMEKLADRIEDLEHDNNPTRTAPNGFSMDYTEYDCGTPSCIAGWACAMKLATSKIPNDVTVERPASEWLGVDHHWAMENLFYPTQHIHYSYISVKPAQAAEVLRTVAKAGDKYQNLNMKKVWHRAMGWC